MKFSVLFFLVATPCLAVAPPPNTVVQNPNHNESSSAPAGTPTYTVAGLSEAGSSNCHQETFTVCNEIFREVPCMTLISGETEMCRIGERHCHYERAMICGENAHFYEEPLE